MNNGNQNYQKQLDKIIDDLTERKKLLLHSCCAPCSSYCLEYLSQFFDITLLYYNPNITEEEEYLKRVSEQQRLIGELNHLHGNGISFVEGAYEKSLYLDCVRGLEKEPEGGARCKECFNLRLDYAARYAAEHGFDYFTTTLTISPLKNASLLNEIGHQMAEKYKVDFLPSDFKKKNGYKRTIELSKEFNLYRQDYCGCIFSKVQREAEKVAEANKDN